MPPPPLDDVFAQLKKLLTPYARHFGVGNDTDTVFGLADSNRHAVSQFAVLVKGARDVQLYFYPLRVFPELRDMVPASLRARIVWKSILKLTALRASERAAIKKLLAAAWSRVAVVRTIDPKRVYNKKFDLDETFAVLDSLARASRRDVTLTKRRGWVELALPSSTRARQPTVYKYKAITPAQCMIVADLLRVPVRKASLR